MKAILLDGFGGPEVMVFTDAPEPEWNSKQVLIRVHATSVNRPDVIQRQGNYPPPPGDSLILGLEAAGTIETVGEQVSGWRIGDRVTALVGGGGYAEFVAAWPEHLIRIPDTISFHEAACIPETYLTAYLVLFLLGKLTDCETVLLHGGGGGVNTAAIHLCRHLIRDCKIIVTASSSKLKRIEDLGVDFVVDYQNQEFSLEVRELTDGQGVDAILDHIGGPYLAGNMKCLAVGGRLLQIGVSEGTHGKINLALLMVKRQHIIGSVLRSRSVQEKGEIIRSFTERVMPFFEKSIFAPLISDVLPLEQAAEGHRMMESSQHFGKIVLAVNSEDTQS
ncbi:MAG: NAD(P)H-quinone oxidoreductase [Gammaproteobacteria bacterium]|nr:NAD(P)H-quinone oxidoreductase [Gammaproteobacteria bacterium]MCY4218026.1 NAD(P)H-quinone oxidoreductase [Gammaproteobacteria bacterium]